MIELAFVTCLLAAPDRCEDHSLLFEESHGVFGCLLEGQHELARWTERHPEATVVRWACRVGGTQGRPADI